MVDGSLMASFCSPKKRLSGGNLLGRLVGNSLISQEVKEYVNSLGQRSYRGFHQILAHVLQCDCIIRALVWPKNWCFLNIQGPHVKLFMYSKMVLDQSADTG